LIGERTHLNIIDWRHMILLVTSKRKINAYESGSLLSKFWNPNICSNAQFIHSYKIWWNQIFFWRNWIQNDSVLYQLYNRLEKPMICCKIVLRLKMQLVIHTKSINSDVYINQNLQMKKVPVEFGIKCFEVWPIFSVFYFIFWSLKDKNSFHNFLLKKKKHF
jgi:hypothetical protein